MNQLVNINILIKIRAKPAPNSAEFTRQNDLDRYSVSLGLVWLGIGSSTELYVTGTVCLFGRPSRRLSPCSVQSPSLMVCFPPNMMLLSSICFLNWQHGICLQSFVSTQSQLLQHLRHRQID